MELDFFPSFLIGLRGYALRVYTVGRVQIRFWVQTSFRADRAANFAR